MIETAAISVLSAEMVSPRVVDLLQARVATAPGPVHIQNNYLMSDVTTLLKILAPYPEAKQAIVDYYRERSPPAEVIEHHDAND